MAHKAADLLAKGTRVDAFEIRSVLGTGGFGITYLALDHDLRRPVALKEFFPTRIARRADDGVALEPRRPSMEDVFAAGRDAFLAEARALAQFRHDSIVRVSRHLRAHGTAYIAMEYERGQTLHSRLRRGDVLTEAQAHALFVPLLDGLHAMHERNFIHGDVKPANVVIRESGAPVLIDFGAVRSEASWARHVSWHTYTPGFAPPEAQVPVRSAGPWSDVYSIGAVLYHCLVGRQPPPASERVFACYFGAEDPLEAALHDTLEAEQPFAARAIRAAMMLDAEERLWAVEAFLGLWEGLGDDAPEARPEALAAGIEALIVEPIIIGAQLREAAVTALSDHLGETRARELVEEAHDKFPTCEEFVDALSMRIDSDAGREEFVAAMTIAEFAH